MVAVGVLVRSELASVPRVKEQLGALEGVTTLDLEELGAIGLVIQSDTLDAAHATLRDEVQATPGVLAAYPLHTQLEPVSWDELDASISSGPQIQD